VYIYCIAQRTDTHTVLDGMERILWTAGIFELERPLLLNNRCPRGLNLNIFIFLRYWPGTAPVCRRNFRLYIVRKYRNDLLSTTIFLRHSSSAISPLKHVHFAIIIVIFELQTPSLLNSHFDITGETLRK